MENNVVELEQFRNKKIYRYLISLSVYTKNKKINFKGFHSFPFEIKPFPKEEFLEHVSDCLTNGCYQLFSNHQINPNEMLIDDFSVQLTEYQTNFYLKDLLPTLQQSEQYQNFLSLHK